VVLFLKNAKNKKHRGISAALDDTNLTLKECLNEKCTVAKIQGNSTFFISSFRKNDIL
jgi:hypothetical protein